VTGTQLKAEPLEARRAADSAPLKGVQNGDGDGGGSAERVQRMSRCAGGNHPCACPETHPGALSNWQVGEVVVQRELGTCLGADPDGQQNQSSILVTIRNEVSVFPLP